MIGEICREFNKVQVLVRIFPKKNFQTRKNPGKVKKTPDINVNFDFINIPRKVQWEIFKVIWLNFVGNLLSSKHIFLVFPKKIFPAEKIRYKVRKKKKKRKFCDTWLLNHLFENVTGKLKILYKGKFVENFSSYKRVFLVFPNNYEYNLKCPTFSFLPMVT